MHEIKSSADVARLAAAEIAAETDNRLPTGRCIITVGTITNCTSGMTQRSCYQVAANVGGVADWTEGARCP